MKNRCCPVCGASSEKSKVFLKRIFNESSLSGYSFSSRKSPEFMTYGLIKCDICHLVYVNNPPSEHELSKSYHDAMYDSAEEALDAAMSYISAIMPALSLLTRKESVLEIGTGSGVFLDLLSKFGFKEFHGVEPSPAAVAAAPPEIQSLIHIGMFNESLYNAASFDLICCFMTMEHVSDPGELSKSAFRLLRPGGAFVVIVHDYEAFINKILGRYSPIIDIEHMQIFSCDSLRYMFEVSGFKDYAVNSFSNQYSMKYWLRLMPVPGFFKSFLYYVLKITGLSGVKIKLNVGNLIAFGFKP